MMLPAGRNVSKLLIIKTKESNRRRRIAAADDAQSRKVGEGLCNHSSAMSKGGELKDPHWSIPKNGSTIF